MADDGFDRRVEAFRHFNRFYTKQIGALGEGLLNGPYSLTEARVLYELAMRAGRTATEIGQALGLDAGYLSRILRKFERRRLVSRTASREDGRQSLLNLTKAGRAAFAALDAGSRNTMGAMLGKLPPLAQARLIEAVGVVERLLAPGSRRDPLCVLRSHRPGDIGWIVHSHGVLYSRDYGWDERFEALVAEIAGNFIQNYEPRRERCWIAERDGVPVGSVMLVQHSQDEAKLRLLLVDPAVRGSGIGARLISEGVRFAREARYRKISLWTQSILVAARHLYEKAGFRMLSEEPHHSFGHDLVGETWEFELM